LTSGRSRLQPELQRALGSRPNFDRGEGLLDLRFVIACGFQLQESVYLLPSLPVYDRFSIELASIDLAKSATVPARRSRPGGRTCQETGSTDPYCAARLNAP